MVIQRPLPLKEQWQQVNRCDSVQQNVRRQGHKLSEVTGWLKSTVFHSAGYTGYTDGGDLWATCNAHYFCGMLTREIVGPGDSIECKKTEWRRLTITLGTINSATLPWVLRVQQKDENLLHGRPLVISFKIG